MTNKTQDEVGNLKSDFEDLRADMTELANSFKAFLEAQQTQASAGGAAAGEVSGATTNDDKDETEWQEFRRKLDEARQHSEQTLEDINEEVAQHPLASLAVAFGVGYLAAKLLK